MSSFPEMEWSARWDWENLMMFGSKVIGSPKKPDWGIEDGGEIDGGSFNLSGGGTGSGRSGSDLGNGSSAKSSLSASTDSPLPEASVGSVEQLLGLKLGKRTYFENSCLGGNAKSPSSVIPGPSTVVAKKTKSSSPSMSNLCCQVEGCNLDLSSAKEYHRKHRVCDSHSKSPKVIVGGLERRFCQQCSRFHNLSEFDEKKRSCRRRLSDHNARRRKPQQDTIQFHSSRIPSSFYDGRQQMNFVLNDGPLVHTRNAANPDWESTRNSKFTITTPFPLKPIKAEGMSFEPQLTGNQLSHGINMTSNPSNGFLALKDTSSPGFSQGFKDSVFSSSVEAAAPDFRRALSLLSNDSWSSFEPGGSISLTGNLGHGHGVPHVGPRSNMNLPMTVLNGVPQGLALASSDYWLNTNTQQQSTYPPRVHTLTSDNEGNEHFEENQVFKTSYESAFYP